TRGCNRVGRVLQPSQRDFALAAMPPARLKTCLLAQENRRRWARSGSPSVRRCLRQHRLPSTNGMPATCHSSDRPVVGEVGGKRAVQGSGAVAVLTFAADSGTVMFFSVAPLGNSRLTL